MPRTSRNDRRQRGHIHRRGGSFQVLVYAGVDPLTGKDSVKGRCAIACVDGLAAALYPEPLRLR